ncbi:MAG: DUF4149 domain-containing protein [Blastocatellia bacterium]
MKSDKIRLAILGLWLGAMAFFSFVIAPAAFAVLPLPQLAGALVSRTLGILEVIGIAIGALLIVILVFSKERGGRAFVFELITLALMTIAMLVSHFAVSRRLSAMRMQFGEISLLAAGDPARITFDRLHQYSVWLMTFDILAAIVLIVFLARRNA